MNQLFLKARAKINLALDVCGKRPDGYHDLRTVMQTLSLYDGMFMKKINKEGYFKLVTNLTYLPNDRRNLVYRAIEAVRERYGLKDGVFVQLSKHIPVSAGLAGGSADCAAALVGARNLFGLPVSIDELAAVGKELGADVPFCVMRGTALAEGIGDRLTRLPKLPAAFVLVAKPPAIISTADIFRDYTDNNVKKRPDIEKMLSFLEKGDLRGVCGEMANTLESVTVNRCPVIGEIKTAMLESGALGALMSGSGPTVFGVYEKRELAVAARDAISTRFQDVKEIFITHTFNAA